MADIEKQLAQAEAKVARLREKKRKEETQVKVILGALLIKEAQQSEEFADIVLKLIDKASAKDKARLVKIFGEKAENLYSPF